MRGQFAVSCEALQTVVVVGYPEVAFTVNAEVGVDVAFREGSRHYFLVVHVEEQDISFSVGAYQGMWVPELHSLDKEVVFVVQLGQDRDLVGGVAVFIEFVCAAEDEAVVSTTNGTGYNQFFGVGVVAGSEIVVCSGISDQPVDGKKPELVSLVLGDLQHSFIVVHGVDEWYAVIFQVFAVVAYHSVGRIQPYDAIAFFVDITDVGRHFLLQTDLGKAEIVGSVCLSCCGKDYGEER